MGLDINGRTTAIGGVVHDPATRHKAAVNLTSAAMERGVRPGPDGTPELTPAAKAWLRDMLDALGLRDRPGKTPGTCRGCGRRLSISATGHGQNPRSGGLGRCGPCVRGDQP